MGRYGNSQLGRKKSNNSSVHENDVLSYRTTLYDKIPVKDTDIHIIIQHGDRLDNLAMEFYGSPGFWWVIAQANGLNSINVEPGTQLRVPKEIENKKGK